jgi:cobalt-zinc-cadmium resistance protein CzcA
VGAPSEPNTALSLSTLWASNALNSFRRNVVLAHAAPTLTMTFVPVMATHLCSRSGRIRENPLLAWLVPRYERALCLALAHSRLVVTATVVVVAVALDLGTRVGREFLPQLDEGVVWIRATLPPGVAIEKSAEIASRMRDAIRGAPEVRLVSSQTGRQDSNTEPFGPNRRRGDRHRMEVNR